MALTRHTMLFSVSLIFLELSLNVFKGVEMVI